MANIAEAAVLIKANARAMEPGLRQAESNLKGFAVSAAKILGGIAIGAAIVSSVRKAAELGGQVKDLAENFNISAESASGLSFAAEQVGISTSTLTTNIGRISKTLGEAIGGSTEAQKAFADLGLQWRTLAAMPTDEVFRQVISSLGDMTNVAQRSAAAQGIFGKSWQEVMELVRGGRGGLADAANRAKELGVVWSAESLEKLERFKRSTNEVGLAFAGLGKSILDSFGPELVVAFKAVADGIGLVSAAVREYRSFINTAFNEGRPVFLNDRSTGWTNRQAASESPMTGTGFSQSQLEAEQARLQGMIIDPASTATAAAHRTSRNAAIALRIVEEQLSIYTSRVGAVIEATGNWADMLKKVSAEDQKIAARNAALAERGRMFEDMGRQAEQLAQSVMTPLERQAAELERIDALWQQGFIDIEMYTRAMEQLEAQQQRMEIRSGAALGAGSVGAADALTAFENSNRSTQQNRNGEVERRLDQANRWLERVHDETREMRRELAALAEDE